MFSLYFNGAIMPVHASYVAQVQSTAQDPSSLRSQQGVFPPEVRPRSAVFVNVRPKQILVALPSASTFFSLYFFVTRETKKPKKFLFEFQK